jgi:hypothetical protein
MGEYRSGLWSKLGVWTAFGVMGVFAIALLGSSFYSLLNHR